MQNNNVIPDTLLETYSCDNNIFAFFCLHCTQIFCIHCHTEYVTIHTYIYLALPLICAPIEKQLGYCKAHGYTVQLTLLLLPKIKLAKKIFLNLGFCLENKHITLRHLSCTSDWLAVCSGFGKKTSPV